MKKHSISEPTLADLLGKASTPGPEAMSLQEWHFRVQNIPLSKLPVGDLARAIRQELALPQTVFIALNTLELEPLAGELFDGEVMSVLMRLPKSFWQERADLCKRLLKLIELHRLHLDLELKVEAKKFWADHAKLSGYKLDV